MGRFAELDTDIGIILNEVLLDKDLCKLLYHNNSKPLESADVSNPTKLISKNIFLHNKIPTVEETGSMISIIFNNFRQAGSKHFKGASIEFNLMIHEDVWLLEGGYRFSKILDILDSIVIAKGRDIGMGDIEFDTCRNVIWNERFTGYQLIYKNIDLS